VVLRPSVLITTIVGFLVVGSCAAIEVGVVASFGEGSADSGFVLAIWAIASLIGGLSFGNLPIGPWALARRVFVILIGATLAIFAWEFWSLAIALVVAGICLAPALAVMFSAVSASVKFSDTAEAYGWVGTGQLIGAAAGSAIAGFLVDGVGSGGAFWASAGFALLAFVVAAVFHRALPDLRFRDASPIPDTDAVPTQPS
jgi:MFS family permease